MIGSKLKSRRMNGAAKDPTSEKVLTVVVGWTEDVAVARMNADKSYGGGASCMALNSIADRASVDRIVIASWLLTAVGCCVAIVVDPVAGVDASMRGMVVA